MASYKNNKNNTEGLARRLVPWLEVGGVRCGWRTIFFYVGAGESFPRGRIFALKASKSGRIFPIINLFSTTRKQLASIQGEWRFSIGAFKVNIKKHKFGDKTRQV